MDGGIAAAATLLEQIQALVAAGRWEASGHARRRMRTRFIPEANLIYGIAGAVVVESYPEHTEGPCLLALQYDARGNPIHIVWGFKYDPDPVASVITAYYPDLDIWEPDFMRRKPE